jgi:hypothetical protein
VDESRALQSDIDESALHARQYTDDTPQIDIADMAPLDAAFYVQLLYRPLFHQRNAGFEGGDIDQDIFAQGDGWGHSVFVSSKVRRTGE